MTEKELKKALKQQADEHTPELADAVLQKAEEQGLFAQMPQEMPVVEKKKAGSIPRRRWGRIAGGLVAVAACCAIILPLALRNKPNTPAVAEPYTSVCMQINPSVELTVKNGKVTKARALNPDGAVLIVHSQLVGKPIAEACLQVAELANSRRLIGAEGITLYVSGEDETAMQSLLYGELTANNYVVKENESAEAERLKNTYCISTGKAKLIAEVLRLYPEYAEERLVKKSAEDLHELIEDYHEEEMENFQATLFAEYQVQYGLFVRDVSEKLGSYRADLNGLNALSPTERDQQIQAFNQTYAILGEDFLIEANEPWREAYAECLEELDEVEEELSENADEAFADLFEDWLEEFQESKFDRDD